MAEEYPQPVDVQRIDGFGIPAFWVPGDGTSTAGIVIRSGRSAEPLALSGITHLVTHLVSNEIGLNPHGPGSYSDLDVFGQSFSGSADEVGAYLSAYASLLSVPPTDDLHDAIEQCKDESANREIGATEHLLRLRHGAQGPGVLSFDEFALRKAGQKQIQNWASRYLHNANAAVWFSGPLPPNPRLRLINGVPVRSISPLLQVPTPGAAYGSKGEVGFSMLLPRSHAFGACMHIAESRAREELINRRGACTKIEFDAIRHGRDMLELTVVADALNDRDDEVLVTLLWVFDSLALVPPTEQEVDEFRNAYAGLWFLPELHAFRARDAAIHHLTGTTIETWQQTYEELDALTAEAIADIAREGLATTLAVASRDCAILKERFTYIGSWVPSLAQGAQFKPIPVEGETAIYRELVVGKAGVTLRDGDHISSVYFSECALVIRGDGGYRELISESGSRVVIIAEAWDKGGYLLDLIDSQSLPERTIVLDENRDHRGGYVGAERRRWAR